MGTYDGTAPDGTQVRVHIDRLDAEFAYVLTCAPGEHSRWSKPMELRRVWEGDDPRPGGWIEDDEPCD